MCMQPLPELCALDDQEYICPLHNKVKELFCISEKELYCVKCNQFHSACQITDIWSFVKDQRIKLETKSGALLVKLNEVVSNLNTLQRIMIQNKDRIQNVREQILQFWQIINQSVHLFFKNVLQPFQEVNDLLNQKQTALQNLENEIQQLKFNIDDQIRKMQETEINPVLVYKTYLKSQQLNFQHFELPDEALSLTEIQNAHDQTEDKIVFQNISKVYLPFKKVFRILKVNTNQNNQILKMFKKMKHYQEESKAYFVKIKRLTEIKDSLQKSCGELQNQITNSQKNKAIKKGRKDSVNLRKSGKNFRPSISKFEESKDSFLRNSFNGSIIEGRLEYATPYCCYCGINCSSLAAADNWIYSCCHYEVCKNCESILVKNLTNIDLRKCQRQKCRAPLALNFQNKISQEKNENFFDSSPFYFELGGNLE